MPETDVSSTCYVAEQIRRSIEASTENVPVTVSIGLTSYRSEKGDWDKTMIFNKADEALYLAKNNGKNCVHVV